MTSLSRSRPASRAAFARIAVSLMLLILLAGRPHVGRAASGDLVADRVLGQADFTTLVDTTQAASATSLFSPYGVAVDRHSGRLYVSDTGNHRVVSWPNAATFTNGQAADIVLGQANFTDKQWNRGGTPTAATLHFPQGIAVDGSGRVYVADAGNNRVLAFDGTISTGMAAGRVFGQPDFTSNAPNNMGISARSLYSPRDVDIDNQGNLYVADTFNDRVLKYNILNDGDASADRVYGQLDFASTYGSNLYSNYRNTLSHPVSLALDQDNNLYVVESGYARVLQYDPSSATVDTTPDRVFGQPNFFQVYPTGGQASAGNLSFPQGVAVDSNGNLYVADRANNRVLQYDTPLISDALADRVFGQPDMSSVAANNGGRSAKSLFLPNVIAVDAGDNVYITEDHNLRLLGFDAPVPPPVLAITRITPAEIAVGGANFDLIVEGTNFNSDAKVLWNGAQRPTTFSIDGPYLTARISAADIAAIGSASITVAISGTSSLSAPRTIAIVAHAPLDEVADRVLGQGQFSSNIPNITGLRGLNTPSGVAVDHASGRLYVVDQSNYRVLSWPSAGAFANGQLADRVIGQPGMNVNRLVYGAAINQTTFGPPTGAAVDRHGNLYVVDKSNSRVLIFEAPVISGAAATRVIGQPDFTSVLPNNGGRSASSLYWPERVAVDANDNVYITDMYNHRVLAYQSPLTTDTVADWVFGQPDFTSGTPNTGGISAASLSLPFELALDAAGNLYIGDLDNHRVLEYDTPLAGDTTADRVFGQPNFTSGALRAPDATSMNVPAGIAIDSQGRLYVADASYSRVLRYDTPLASGGNPGADRVFGQPNFTSIISNAGGISATSLNSPADVALDGNDNLYIADGFNNRVLGYDQSAGQTPIGTEYRIHVALVLR